MNQVVRKSAEALKGSGFFSTMRRPAAVNDGTIRDASRDLHQVPDLSGMSEVDILRFDTKLIQAVEHTRFGHMGDEEFLAQGGMEKWAAFLEEHQFYDIPRREIDLLKERVKDTAKILKASGIKAVTLVSHGPGTMFAEKEGLLIDAFDNAGIKVEKVVLIDGSMDALNHSVKAAQTVLNKTELAQNAEIEIVQGDIFDPSTKEKYTLAEGTVEIATIFGLTAMNAEGGAKGMPPKTSIKEKIQGLFDKMSDGAHLLSPYDHRENASQNEMAYGGQEAFAKNMFTSRFGWSMKQMKDIQFSVKYHPQSGILAHMLEFTKKRTLDLVTGALTIPAGLSIHFNSSIKFSKKATQELHEEIGFEYVEPVKTKQDFGWHHLAKPANRLASPSPSKMVA